MKSAWPFVIMLALCILGIWAARTFFVPEGTTGVFLGGMVFGIFVLIVGLILIAIWPRKSRNLIRNGGD